MVAAVLVVILAIAVVAVVRKSADMQLEDYHGRQARAVIMEHFETAFNHYNFSAVPGHVYTARVRQSGGDVVSQVVDVNESDNFAFIPAGGIEFVLDDRSGGIAGKTNADPLNGRIFFRARADVEPLNMSGVPLGAQSLNYHDVTIKVRWSEVGGVLDSVELTKRLAKIW